MGSAAGTFGGSQMVSGIVRGCACALALVSSGTAALAQFGGTPIVPGDTFRRPAPPPAAVAPPAPPAVAAPARPAATANTISQPAPPVRTASVSLSPEPIYDEGTRARLSAAFELYSAIEARGGWPAVPKSAQFIPGGRGAEVALLRQRLAATADLDPRAAAGDAYDEALVAAVKRFQARHGLTETGSIGPQTLEALNVPVETRVRQLAASLERLAGMSFLFGHRYVVVNIPAAVVEAVTDGRVERRYVAVVGKPDRPSPTLTASITAVNLNPTWTVPLSIAKKDVVPKMRKDPAYLSRMHMRLLDSAGNEIDPSQVDWHSDRVPAFAIRQDPGAWNALGSVRVDMPNAYSVYMHDTNHKNLFSGDYRFQSSGCTRVSDPRDFAAWLLQDNKGWSRREIDAGIATGQRTDIRLAHALPVAWIYLTGWGSRDGTVNFRPDPYGHDARPVKPFMVSLPHPMVTAARSSGFTLQSEESRPAVIREVSYLDSQ